MPHAAACRMPLRTFKPPLYAVMGGGRYGLGLGLGCLFPACAPLLSAMSHVPCPMLWLSKRFFSLPFAFQFHNFTISPFCHFCFFFSCFSRCPSSTKHCDSAPPYIFFLFRSHTPCVHRERFPFGIAVMALLL